VGQDGDPIGPSEHERRHLGDEFGPIRQQRPGPSAMLPAVAVGAVADGFAPLLPQARDVGRLVDHPRRQDQLAAGDPAAVRQVDLESAVDLPRAGDGPVVEGRAVRDEPLAGDPPQLGRPRAVAALSPAGPPPTTVASNRRISPATPSPPTRRPPSPPRAPTPADGTSPRSPTPSIPRP